MRIIHNIGQKKTQQMTASGFAYRGETGSENLWRGWHCELLIVSRDQLTGAEQALEIEGNGDDVINALRTAAKMLEGYRETLRASIAEGQNVNPQHKKITTTGLGPFAPH